MKHGYHMPGEAWQRAAAAGLTWVRATEPAWCWQMLDSSPARVERPH